MSEQQPVVSVEGVSKKFPRGNVVALQDIDLRLESGEFVSLIGPSGCGKSTLLRVIGDLVEPTTAPSANPAAASFAVKNDLCKST